MLLIFVADQATKFWVLKAIPMGTRIEVIPLMNFIHTKNRGAAFGMFNQAGGLFRFFFFGAVTVICLYYLIYLLGSTLVSERLHRFCYALILGGAFGNLLDRVAYGEVTDFVDVYYGHYHFYTFNIADSAISVGVTLLIASWISWKKILGRSSKDSEVKSS